MVSAEPIHQFMALPEADRARVMSYLPEAERMELLLALEDISYVYDHTLINRVYPDTGQYCRDRYRKQMELYELGLDYQFRALLGGNGTGKTWAAGCEMTYHLTGEYPRWWKGKRFTSGIRAWAAGDTIATTRDIIQSTLLGEDGAHGTGLIPGHLILRVVARQNGNGAIDKIHVRHKSGTTSTLYFKSYDQGRLAFQGRNVHFIWLDEECPMPIYVECVHRFRGDARDGRLLLTFTPLRGITDVVKLFMPQLSGEEANEDELPDKEFTAGADSRTYVLCGWEDIPHLTEEEKIRKLGNTLPFEREARMRGIPTAGRGRIFIVEEESFVVRPFKLPPHWPIIYGADFGFGAVGDKNTGTACVWGAWDPATDTVYLFDEYFRHQQPPAVHATAIKSRGEWIKGVGDYSGKSLEGEKTLDIYRELGLHIINADKSVYAGLQLMTQMLNEGRIRVFSTCQKWLEEYRLYSFNEKNEVIKTRDHLMDSTRYLLMADRRRATTKPMLKGQATAIAPETFGLYRRN